MQSFLIPVPDPKPKLVELLAFGSGDLEQLGMRDPKIDDDDDDDEPYLTERKFPGKVENMTNVELKEVGSLSLSCSYFSFDVQLYGTQR